MRLQYFNPYKSITSDPVLSELPNFTLITGLNGAGKTHLLESLREGRIQLEGGFTRGLPRLLTTQDLQSVDHLSAAPETREQKVSRFKDAVRLHAQNMGWSEALSSNLRDNIVANGVMTMDAIVDAERRAGKALMYWTDSDYSEFTPMNVGIRDMFTTLVTDTFFSYVYLHTLNGYQRWRSEVFGEQHAWLTNEKFVDDHGMPPWELLNQVLADSDLPYRYDPPSPTLTTPFPALRLVDVGMSRDVAPTELSGGERTLLTIALTAYSANVANKSISLPSMILLDEPDATLHPTMVRVLLNLVQSRIVEGLGVPVILTTHSPTTVALADEESIHVMTRTGQPRLKKMSRDHALRDLLVGVPALSVKAENRRTVIVEAPTDERIYTMMRTVLGSRIDSDRSLQFMAAGGSGLADGCDAVIDLVARLRERGNDQVWGLVDRDYRVDQPSDKVFMDETRHSIENLLFDPLPLSMLLVRDGVMKFLEGTSADTYPEIAVADAQLLVDSLTLDVFESVAESKICHYSEGLDLSVDTRWLETQGHELEDRIVTKYPRLKRYPRISEALISQIWAEKPWAVPASILSVFSVLSV